MIHPVPIVWITESGVSDKISERRHNNLLKQEKSLAPHVSLHIIPQIKARSKKHATKRLLLIKLKKARELTDDPNTLIMITQDDVQFCKEFIPQLGKSLRELPSDWRLLHLCAGYLYGRGRGKDNRSKLDAELPNVVPLDPEGAIPADKRVGRFCRMFAPAWPGGPVAFILRQRNISDILESIRRMAPGEGIPDDVTLFKIAGDGDYMQMSPVLCHEREQGDTSWSKTYSASNYADAPFRSKSFSCAALALCVLIAYFLRIQMTRRTCA